MRTKYHKKYALKCATYMVSSGKKTQRDLAAHFGVTLSTIQSWIESHPDFEYAYKNAKALIDDTVNDAILKNVTENKVIDRDGRQEIIPPQAADHAVALKANLGGTKSAEDEVRKQTINKIVKRNVNGEITALDAMKLIEAEGYKAPKSLELEVKAQLLNSKEESFTQSILTEEQRKEVDEFKKQLADKFDCD